MRQRTQASAAEALFSLIAISFAPNGALVPVPASVVVVAVVMTGTIGATLGRGKRLRAALRLVIGGALALAATYGVGQFVSVATS